MKAVTSATLSSPRHIEMLTRTEVPYQWILAPPNRTLTRIMRELGVVTLVFLFVMARAEAKQKKNELSKYPTLFTVESSSLEVDSSGRGCTMWVTDGSWEYRVEMLGAHCHVWSKGSQIHGKLEEHYLTDPTITFYTEDEGGLDLYVADDSKVIGNHLKRFVGSVTYKRLKNGN